MADEADDNEMAIDFSDQFEEEDDEESHIPIDQTSPSAISALDITAFPFYQLASQSSSFSGTIASENTWFVHYNGILIQPSEAFERIMSVETKLGSKSTASIFLLALRYALSSGDVFNLQHLSEKLLHASSEFSRKVAFRLLSGGNDKLNSLIRLFISNSIKGNNFQIFHSLSLSLTLIRQVLLSTVDVRLIILRQHVLLIKWLCLMLIDLSKIEDRSVHSLLDLALKCLQDLSLAGEEDDFYVFLQVPLIDALTALIKVEDENTADNCIRLLSFIFEYACADLKNSINESGLFAEIMNQLKNNVHTHLRILDHFASHFTTRIPPKDRESYFQCFVWMKQMVDPQNNPTTVHKINRCLITMNSVGIRIASFVMNREIIEIRKQKQVWMKRQCEGCLRTELQFGEFMMCAGCRKVRYCSKDCQVRDWKYHRMSCHFFRPRPGFRSRGTQTSCDASTQTDETTSNSSENSNDIRRADSTDIEFIQTTERSNSGEGRGWERDGEGGRVNFLSQTEVSWPVNYRKWKFEVRKDEETMTS